MSAVDILHVRQGQNYLVDDFTRMDRLRDDPAAMAILSRVAQEIGFDRVCPYERTGDRWKRMPEVPFAEWNNPYFAIIAARHPKSPEVQRRNAPER